MVVVVVSSVHWTVMRRAQTILGGGGGRLVPCGFPRPMNGVSEGQHGGKTRDGERGETRRGNITPGRNEAFTHFLCTDHDDIPTHFQGAGLGG